MALFQRKKQPTEETLGFWQKFLGRQGGMVLLLILSLIGLYLFAWREMRFFRVPSSSMEPTLYPVDQLVTLNESRYERGDIVVVWQPEENEYVVKRIAGIAGDAITVYDGALFVNGAYASEPYLAEPMGYTLLEPVKVPKDCVFLLGDNRNNSHDGHITLQSEPISDIVGKLRWIYFPYNRAGPVPSYPLTNSNGE